MSCPLSDGSYTASGRPWRVDSCGNSCWSPARSVVAHAVETSVDSPWISPFIDTCDAEWQSRRDIFIAYATGVGGLSFIILIISLTVLLASMKCKQPIVPALLHCTLMHLYCIYLVKPYVASYRVTIHAVQSCMNSVGLVHYM